MMAESVSMVCWGLISLVASRHLPCPSLHPTRKGKVAGKRADSVPVASLYSSILPLVCCLDQLMGGGGGGGNGQLSLSLPPLAFPSPEES
jgi:hypothetical protein